MLPLPNHSADRHVLDCLLKKLQVGSIKDRCEGHYYYYHYYYCSRNDFMQQYMSAGIFNIEDSQSTHKNTLLSVDLLRSNEFHHFVVLIMNPMKDTLNHSDGQRRSAKTDPGVGHALTIYPPIGAGTSRVNNTTFS